MKMILHPDVLHRSGRLDGQVNIYRKGRGSVRNLVRAFTPPSNPNTVYQVTQRAIFSSVQNGWASMTQVARDAWSLWAETYYNSQIDPQTLEPYELTGQSLYVASQLLNISAGGVLNTSAPTDIPINQPVEPVDAAAVSATGVITMNPSFSSAVANVRVRITEAYEQGYANKVGRLRNPFKSGSLDQNWDAAVDLSASSVAITTGASFVNMKSDLIPTTLDYILIEFLLASENDYLPNVSSPGRRQLQITVT